MKNIGPVLVGLLLLGVIGWEACQGSRSLTEWKADTTRTFQGVQAREDSAEAMLQLGMRLVEQGEQAKQEGARLAARGAQSFRAALSLRGEADSLLRTSHDTSGALYTALGAFDSLRVGYDSLKSAYDLQGEALSSLDSAFWSQAKRAELYRESVDSLSALVRRPRGDCKILSVIPCPSLTVGYGVVENEGIRTGLGATFGWSIPLGRR